MQILAVAVTYGEPRCHPFLAKKTDRTWHVRLAGKMSDSVLLMGGSCPHVRFFRIAGIQYTHFWSVIRIFTICQRSRRAKDLRALVFRSARIVFGWLVGLVAHKSFDVAAPGRIGPGAGPRGRDIGTWGGPGGAAGPGVGCPAFTGPSCRNRRLAVRRCQAGEKFGAKKQMSASGFDWVHWDPA